MLSRWWVTAAGYGVAVLLGWLLLNAKTDLGVCQEECNTRIATGAAKAESAARLAERLAAKRREQQILSRLQDEREARVLSEMATEEARKRYEAAILTISNLMDDTNATPSTACLAVPLPAAAIDSLR